MVADLQHTAEDLAPITVDEAVYRTVLYADIFDFPLTRREVARRLVAPDGLTLPVHHAVERAMAGGSGLAGDGTYLFLPGREEVVAIRERRAAVARKLWPWARRYARLIWAIPFVRMVAVTGALAVDNVERSDDIDLLLVTAPGRLWLTRALILVLCRFARLSGHRLCPNYLLSSRALRLDRQDLYTAYELVQMVPLHGEPAALQLWAQNRWYRDYLPHARMSLPGADADRLPWPARALKRLGEMVLGLPVFDRLERWERRRKTRLLLAGTEGAEMALSAEVCKGHRDGHGARILRQYAERLSR